MREESTTEWIVEEAQRRGISIKRYPQIYNNAVLLSIKDHHEWILFSNSDRVGHATLRVLTNKMLTTAWLRDGGFDVPADRLTTDIAEAKAFLKQYRRIVVKPLSLLWGKGVTPGIETEEELEDAFEKVIEMTKRRRIDPQVVCQEHVDGRDYRFLVVDKEHVFVAERRPAHVIGDGRSSLRQLVESKNADREPAKHITLSRDQAQSLLREQGLSAEDVPEQGQHVQLSRIANTHAGGTIQDITAAIPEDIKEKARVVARFVNISLVAVDCISPDARTDFGKIIELNATPDLRYPEEEVTEDIAGRVVDMLFPESKSSAE